MMPAFGPGDHVLTFNFIIPKIGDVIVFERDGKKYLKRIEKIKDDLIYVAGDNKEESVGATQIKKVAVIGKVVLKY